MLGADTASTLCEMLGSVVQEDGGTAFRRAEDLKKLGFSEVASFAGKTGTAVLHKDPSRMNGTFAVFGPMPEPKVVVVFVAFDSGARFGGDQCAGPAMRALARRCGRSASRRPPRARSPRSPWNSGRGRRVFQRRRLAPPFAIQQIVADATK